MTLNTTGTFPLQHQGVVMGTTAYMSPEQALGGAIDRRTDVWSLGVLLYEMATGRRPFSGSTASVLIQTILQGEPTEIRLHREDAPAALEQIIGRCLSKDPDARYPSAEALLADLRAWPSAHADDAAGKRDDGLAVLPFETLGPDATSIFAEGMHGDLLTRLSSVSGLSVISRTSVRQYRNAPKGLAEICRELRVAWVLEGEVQQVADQIQVNVRLVQAPSDRQVWSRQFRRTLTAESLFEIQGEITGHIVTALELRLTPEEQRQVERAPTSNLAAYHLFVQGRTSLDQRTLDSLSRALDCFQRAIAEDANYALAWAGLADTLSLCRFYSHPVPADAPEPLAAARRAAALDPALGEAHTSLGIVHVCRQDGPAALAELRRAIELTPGYAEAHVWLAWTELCLGRADAAIAPAQRAVGLDPRAPAIRAYLAEVYLANGETELALREALSARDLQPAYGLAHFIEGLVLLHRGALQEAVATLQRVLALVPANGTPSHAEARALLVAAFVGLGEERSARDQVGGEQLDGCPVPEPSNDTGTAIRLSATTVMPMQAVLMPPVLANEEHHGGASEEQSEHRGSRAGRVPGGPTGGGAAERREVTVAIDRDAGPGCGRGPRPHALPTCVGQCLGQRRAAREAVVEDREQIGGFAIFQRPAARDHCPRASLEERVRQPQDTLSAHDQARGALTRRQHHHAVGQVELDDLPRLQQPVLFLAGVRCRPCRQPGHLSSATRRRADRAADV